MFQHALTCSHAEAAGDGPDLAPIADGAWIAHVPDPSGERSRVSARVRIGARSGTAGGGVAVTRGSWPGGIDFTDRVRSRRM
jgi:hypothetical protein